MSPGEVFAMTAKARAYQRGRNAGKISGQEQHSGRTAPKRRRLNSNHVKSAKNPCFLYCCRYQRVMYPEANTVQHRVRIFTISQKTKPNSKKGCCPLCTGNRWRNSEQKDSAVFLTLCNVRHLLVGEQIIPYYEEKRMEEM